jgi:hypothetical protein
MQTSHCVPARLHHRRGRASEGFVDDYAIDRSGSWDDDGAELLLATSERLAVAGVDALRVVTAQAALEPPAA